VIQQASARAGADAISCFLECLAGVVLLTATHGREHFAGHLDTCRAHQTTKIPGKMKSTSGKISLTAVLAAFSSANCCRRVRIESLWTRSALAMLEPNLSAWIKIEARARRSSTPGACTEFGENWLRVRVPSAGGDCMCRIHLPRCDSSFSSRRRHVASLDQDPSLLQRTRPSSRGHQVIPRRSVLAAFAEIGQRKDTGRKSRAHRHKRTNGCGGSESIHDQRNATTECQEGQGNDRADRQEGDGVGFASKARFHQRLLEFAHLRFGFGSQRLWRGRGSGFLQSFRQRFCFLSPRSTPLRIRGSLNSCKSLFGSIFFAVEEYAQHQPGDRTDGDEDSNGNDDRSIVGTSFKACLDFDVNDLADNQGTYELQTRAKASSLRPVSSRNSTMA
jgi:hypothetical protein